jgi:hypothetical protein
MNEFDQSNVAYETGPKEVSDYKGLSCGNKQFPGNKMPQKRVKTKSYPANPTLNRYGEYR